MVSSWATGLNLEMVRSNLMNVLARSLTSGCPRTCKAHCCSGFQDVGGNGKAYDDLEWGRLDQSGSMSSGFGGLSSRSRGLASKLSSGIDALNRHKHTILLGH